MERGLGFVEFEEAGRSGVSAPLGCKTSFVVSRAKLLLP